MDESGGRLDSGRISRVRRRGERLSRSLRVHWSRNGNRRFRECFRMGFRSNVWPAFLRNAHGELLAPYVPAALNRQGKIKSFH